MVIASGYEADGLLPDRLTRFFSTFAVAGEPTDGFAGWPDNRCVIWETAFPYHYLRTTPDGRPMIGGGDEPFHSAGRRDRGVAEKARALVRRFRQWFPWIAFEPACAWAGTFAHTALVP